MGFLWWGLRSIKEKIQSTIKGYSETIIKMMSDFQDIQKDFLTITKRMDSINKRLERLERK
jgi:hypothetical protein